MANGLNKSGRFGWRQAILLVGLLAPAAVTALAPFSAMAQPQNSARAEAPTIEPDLPASDLLLRYESPELHFRWSLAPEAALEPDLVKGLRLDALADRTRARREAGEAPVRDPPMQQDWIETWHSEAETDLLLAFSAELYTFTGGAHGNLVLKAVLFDRGLGRRIGFADLFDDPAAADAALRPAFCKALDEERMARRGGQLSEAFRDCLDPAAYPIVPVGDGRISELRVLVPPYEAGPWAEGRYEIGLDAALVRPFLKERYRPIFTIP